MSAIVAGVEFEALSVGASNYDRELPGTGVADSLKTLVSGNYSAYFPALEADRVIGDKVVKEIVEHWAERELTLPD